VTSNSSEHFLTIPWPKTVLDDTKQETRAEALPAPPGARWKPGGLF